MDHDTASINRPSVVRVLVEFDISQPLLPRIWIGKGNSGFGRMLFLSGFQLIVIH